MFAITSELSRAPETIPFGFRGSTINCARETILICQFVSNFILTSESTRSFTTKFEERLCCQGFKLSLLIQSPAPVIYRDTHSTRLPRV